MAEMSKASAPLDISIPSPEAIAIENNIDKRSQTSFAQAAGITDVTIRNQSKILRIDCYYSISYYRIFYSDLSTGRKQVINYYLSRTVLIR
jgi:hypothetical protein